jgi:electron transfer flavoprotein beta subunit
MRIFVCVKQVPDTTKVAIDQQTGTLIRSGVESKTNPYDLAALETAFDIRQRIGGKVIAISMGPPQAADVIRESLALGADDGILITDKAFAGSDVLATAYTLSRAITAVGGSDLIICGKQTTDGDTAQVGPALAEFLDIPHAAWVVDIPAVDEKSITVTHDLTDRILTVKMNFPCLITVEKCQKPLHLPSYIRKKQFAGREITVLNLSDFDDTEPSHYGSYGSPTRVEKIFPPTPTAKRIMFEGDSEKLAKDLARVLRNHKFIGGENIPCRE